MHKSLVIIILAIFAFTVVSCKNGQPQPAVSFYYWKTDFLLKANETATLKENNVRKLYVRYFDIIYNENLKCAGTAAPVRFPEKIENIEIVPVVFIKNKVFETLDSVAIVALANNTFSLLSQINKSINSKAKELQIDCDWTAKSSNKYFLFLRFLRKNIMSDDSLNAFDKNAVLSATIRLHQVKYTAQQGVPPVDKGVLMCYNIGRINNSEDNSIYDRNVSLKYFSALKSYPLKLDFALPVFAWGIHLRNGKIIELLNKMDSRGFQKKEEFEQIKANRYKALNSFFKNGFYFKKEDEIKIEELSSSDLKSLAQDLQQYYDRPAGQIIFYDLDSNNISRYEKDIFKKTVAGF